MSADDLDSRDYAVLDQYDIADLLGRVSGLSELVVFAMTGCTIRYPGFHWEFVC